MSGPMPEFVSLTPVVMGFDRVLLNLETTNFRTKTNLFLEFEPNAAEASTTRPTADEPIDLEEIMRNSPYPNVELAILDPEERQVASLFVVEHKEPFISMTMHIRRPRPGEIYTARAEMIHAQQTLQVMTTSFTLELPAGDAP